MKDLGLDMYLHSIPKIEGLEWKEILLAGNRFHQTEENKLKVYHDYLEKAGKTPKELIEEVGYWRKANQIHHWFVENIQNGQDDCRNYLVTKESLQNLLDLSKKVLVNKASASEFLPTTPGFFFGSLAYDYFYEMEISQTHSLLENLLKHFDFDTHYLIYTSSW